MWHFVCKDCFWMFQDGKNQANCTIIAVDVSLTKISWNLNYKALLKQQAKDNDYKYSKAIVRWLNYQRQKSLKGMPSTKHWEKLEAAGIVLRPYQWQKPFKTRIKQLQQFKNIHGHVNVKSHHNVDPEYFGRYNFLQCMRDKFHKGDLPAKECNILLATGARLDYVKPP